MVATQIDHGAPIARRPQTEAPADVVSEFYERALEGAPGDFVAWSLAQLVRQIGADAAAWIVAPSAPDPARAPALHGRTGVQGVDLVAASEAVRHAWGEVAAATARAVARPLRPQGAANQGLARAPPAPAGQLLLRVCRHPATLFSSVLCLYRAGAASFSADECALLDRQAPHLVGAELLAHRARLRLDALLQQAGRRNRGAGCVCDRSGAIFASSPEFTAEMQKRFGSWDGLRLPFALPPADAARPRAELSIEGMHLRLEQSGWQCLLSVRPPHSFDELTRRERDIVKAMVNGHSFKVLARHLGLSPSTVANHASNIYQKLGVYSRDDVVELARKTAVPDAAALRAG